MSECVYLPVSECVYLPVSECVFARKHMSEHRKHMSEHMSEHFIPVNSD